jgi:hypothetical protein
MAVEFEKEYDDEVYEDEYYDEHFDEEELSDEEDLGAAGYHEVDITEGVGDTDEDEADDGDEADELDDDEDDPAKKKKKKNLRKIEVSYACEDCDYRWEDYILKKKDEIDDGEDFDVVCPMCGSTTITLI